jgi:curved DNA-binding protein
MDLGQAIAGGEVRLEVPGHDKPVTVRIPPGADEGSIIRLKGMGGKSPGGGPPGDLVIVTRVRPHPVVRRDGLDLTMRVPVTLNEAYNGATIEIPTFDGPIKLRIPPRSQSGAKLRVRGKGVPRKAERGDLFVELDVRLPDREDERLAEASATATRRTRRR